MGSGRKPTFSKAPTLQAAKRVTDLATDGTACQASNIKLANKYTQSQLEQIAKLLESFENKNTPDNPVYSIIKES